MHSPNTADFRMIMMMVVVVVVVVVLVVPSFTWLTVYMFLSDATGVTSSNAS